MCRALVAGFGRPALRDLDFGRQVIEYFEQLDWPDGVVVEDLSCSVPLVLHRLQELRPAKLVLLGAVPRGLDPPGTLRRYRLEPSPAGPAQVPGEGDMDLGDLDHTLAIARRWGGLPADTVVIEVEPGDDSFGLGFSEAMAACIDPMLDIVREELADVAEAPYEPPGPDSPAYPELEREGAVDDLLDYARHHAEARRQAPRPPAVVAGAAVAGRVRPWGVFVASGGDWFDAIALEDGRLGVVVGDVAGRGVEAAATMSDLRAAVRAYAVMDGGSPARLVGHLDRLAQSTGLGREARLLYLTLEPATGEVRLVNAGGCPPVHLDATPTVVEDGIAAPLGDVAERTEVSLRLGAGSTLLLYTDGLVESRAVPRAAGMERLRRAAVTAPDDLDRLCEHVLDACTADGRRDDDICIAAVRLAPAAVPSRRVQG